MKLHILSDIHMERSDYVPLEIPQTNSDAIVLAGDINSGFDSTSAFLKELAQEHDKKIFYVLVNNCAYGSVLHKLRDEWAGADIDSVHYLDDNISTEFMGYTFHGGTFWPLYQDMSDDQIVADDEIRMGKKKKISYDHDNRAINAFDYIEQTKRSLGYLDTALNENEKNIVISHFAPSWKSQHKFWHEGVIQGRHASNMEDFINNHNIKLWIHGHIHYKCDYMVGETRIMSNPVPPETFQKNELDKVIEVS
jgi:Icc-related predicted phosphoesterase